MGSQPQAHGPELLPWPCSVDRGSGALRLSSARFEALCDGEPASDRLQRAVDRLSRIVSSRCALPLEAPVPIRIRCDPGDPFPPLEPDESYWLVVDDAGLYLDAASEWGALRALMTLAQLVSGEGVVPHVAVDDRARFSWRGLLLDPARHFLPAQDLLRTLDGMACCKLNVLHLHLSDDQGFRLPVPALPKLTSREAYTADELTRVVAHAADLGIRVVPEIDMPGHVTSWLTAYPEWGARQVAPTERFGVHGACLDPSNEAVFEAVGHILDALVRVFPDPCVHIGGDEVSPRWWSEDPNIRSLMARESLTDLRAVQGYFNRRVGEMAAARGRQVVAWDEVLESGAPDGWIVQAWRGATSRDRALVAGARVVVSAPYYLDLNYPVDVHGGFDPAAPQDELVAREDALLTDPRFAAVADGIRWTGHWREGAVRRDPPAGDPHLLGGEACLWGELVTPAVLDVRLWGRLPAVAERLWSAPDAPDLLPRLDRFLDEVLPGAGIDLAARQDAALTHLGITGPWREVVAMAEPVKWYGRLLGAEALAARIEGREMPQSRPYGVDSALDGLVDHLSPESRQARRLASLCRSAADGDESATRLLEKTLAGWQALAGRRDEAPAGLGDLTDRLSRLGSLIDARLSTGETADAGLLAELCAPSGELTLALPVSLQEWLTRR